MALEELPGIRGNSKSMPPSEATTLAEAISQLGKVLTPEPHFGLTTEYLVRLQNALEAAERAVRAERWAREGYEFQGDSVAGTVRHQRRVPIRWTRDPPSQAAPAAARF